MTTPSFSPWLALVIGNTRLHWGYFSQGKLTGCWHTAPLSVAAARQLVEHQFQAEAWQRITSAIDSPSTELADNFPQAPLQASDLWMASVVPEQTHLWQTVAKQGHVVARSQIPLQSLYPTCGIDRAMTLLGAGARVGWPCLVIDGGTALTFTAGIQQPDGSRQLYGGAILPGLRLQTEALQGKTALPNDLIPANAELANLNSLVPERWAMATSDAISSGLFYSLSATLIDYLTNWWQQFPSGHALLTGGDASWLHHALQQRTPEIASRVHIEHSLMFYGLQTYRSNLLRTIAES